ncbi:MAG: cupin domain-containing protein [Lachnospiraceae bacterium]|nr:cupin domain-containing protein [Lachnospiraceae bacterium]
MPAVEESNLMEVAQRIREMREISGYSVSEMAEKTEVSLDTYLTYESGQVDLPFTFIHKCALTFRIGISDLLEGQSARLSSYTVTRKGHLMDPITEDGIQITNMAPMFRNKIAEPYYVKYDYSAELQNQPIHTTSHSGQEFDYVMEGRLKVQVGNNVEYLSEGDSIFYNSSTPHGMIAVDGRSCTFLAIIMPGSGEKETIVRDTLMTTKATKRNLVCDRFVDTVVNEKGLLTAIGFHNEETFNFGFDVVDAIARKNPDKLAMLHIANDGTERRFSFRDIKRASNQCANYFRSLGIKKGDKVMLVLKRHYQFWHAIVGLHKLGAIAIPATSQLQAHDFEYRFNLAEVKAIVATTEDDVPHQVELCEKNCPTLETKILVGGSREGWHDYNDEIDQFSAHFYRTKGSPCGNDTMIMFFTSGTTGYPKIAAHSYTYPLGHFITAKYWHGVSEQGLHFTISDTGWGKALWGKLYGQWLSEGAVFTYDFDRFNAAEILPMFAKYHITTFCAPPTILRMLIKEDLNKYDLSSIVHMTTAGEALNPEVYIQFEKATGLQIMEGFGQTETTMSIGNLIGGTHKLGSMGKPSPLYDVDLLDEDGNPVEDGEPGEICIRTTDRVPCGLFQGYYRDEAATKEVWHDGWYHTRDQAWRDEDGFLWYIGRVDDVIKSSGYRIGPFEIESVIMELPYVLECGVSAEPDEVRGQVVKASIVLVKGTEPTDALKKEIQNYVKEHTAPYKYPRIVVFRDELPKTISGKIQRNLL